MSAPMEFETTSETVAKRALRANDCVSSMATDAPGQMTKASHHTRTGNNMLTRNPSGTNIATFALNSSLL